MHLRDTFRPGEEAGARGLAWGHTACRPWGTDGTRVARAARPSLGGAEGAAGGSRGAQVLREPGRDLQRLERWSHKDVHWSHTPPYLLRLSPPGRSHSLALPRTSSTRPAPSKPRAAGRHPALLLRSLRGHGDGTGAATGISGRQGRLAGQKRRPISAGGG
jgi:hypothetical protein